MNNFKNEVKLDGNFSLVREKKGDIFSIQNKCGSCGWTGKIHFDYNDTMHMDCINERTKHKC